jgi:excisionase family DNA binding protein
MARDLKLFVVDTGPLITLAVARSLDYLLFVDADVIIPDAVLHEATRDAARLSAQDIIGEMASGNAVQLIPQHAELTTQEAADLFNVSRPYFARLLDEGRMPFHRVGAHRRVYLADVLAYKAEHHRARRKTLDDLSALDQELGL